jgi:hypothetical protein
MLDSKATNLLGEICGHGALVGLGTTRDGGALGVTVTVDGSYRREYFRDAEELVAWLEVADAVVREIWELNPPVSSVKPLRGRRKAL